MLKTRDMHLKEITEQWIDEHEEEVNKLKLEISKLHSEIATKNNKGRFKYNNQEEVLKDLNDGILTRKQYCDYCYGRGWKIEKQSRKKYNFSSYEELEQLYLTNNISLSVFRNLKYDYFPNESRHMSKFNYNSYDELLDDLNKNIITKHQFYYICQKNNWNFDRERNK